VDLLRHLRYFAVVADELHFGRAAERLHMSQPPLSQRIRALEERVGGALLSRTSRRVELTPLGRRLLPEAQALLAHADRMSSLLDTLSDEELHELRVGLPPEMPAVLVGSILGFLRRQHPGAEVDLVQAPPRLLEQELRAGVLEVALLRHPVPAGLRFAGVLRRPLGVLVREDSPLAREEEVEVFDLGGHELVLFPREQAPTQYDELVADLRALGFAPSSIRPADGASVAAGLVLAGGAVALADRLPADAAGLAWRPLVAEPLWLRMSVVRGVVSRGGQEPDEELARLIAAADGWQLTERGPERRPHARPASGLLA